MIDLWQIIKHLIAVDLTDGVEQSSTAKVAVTIKSKWELVDYGDDSDK